MLLTLLPLLGRAGTPVLTFQATIPSSAGGDVTAFVDQVEIINASTGAVVANAVPNASFETFASLANGNYGYAPGGASWTFNTQSDIAAKGSAFNPPAVTNSSYVAFVQTTASRAGAFSQTLPALPAGTYQVRVQLAQRNTIPANQGVAILVDGREVGRSVPTNDGAFHSFVSSAFVVDAVLRLEATGSPSQPAANVTAFADAVELLDGATGTLVAGTPVPNPSFETFTAPLSNISYGYRPAGATWTFADNSGVAADGSDFKNPYAPNGKYVAFLQSVAGTGGSASQVLPLAMSGNYQLRLQQAQRTSTLPADQGVRVYLNNMLLGTFWPIYGSLYQSFTTGFFSPVAGLAPAPAITSFTPTGGPTGTSVVILPAGATLLYYRLRQVDQDGTFSYSPVRTVALTGAAAGLALFPNPTHGGTATLTGARPGAVVTVLDALGRAVLVAPADAAGTAVLALPPGLASGVYVVRTGSQALRLTVE